MRSNEFRPNTRPDLSLDPSVLRSTTRPNRSTKPLWIWIVILVLSVLYAVSPIDFIPDLIPVLGWIDDVVITLSGIIIALPRIIKRQ